VSSSVVSTLSSSGRSSISFAAIIKPRALALWRIGFVEGL
jgi:hypothetical protein